MRFSKPIAFKIVPAVVSPLAKNRCRTGSAITVCAPVLHTPDACCVTGRVLPMLKHRSFSLFVAILAGLAGLANLSRGQDAPSAQDQPAATDRLLVGNKAEHSLSIFDPVTRKELAVLPTGKGPHEIAISPDGRTAVVSNYGAEEPGRSLTVVDVLAAKVLRTIELNDEAMEVAERIKTRVFLRPHGCAFVDDTHLVVTSELTRALIVVDLSKGVVERELRTYHRLFQHAEQQARAHPFPASRARSAQPGAASARGAPGALQGASVLS